MKDEIIASLVNSITIFLISFHVPPLIAVGIAVTVLGGGFITTIAGIIVGIIKIAKYIYSIWINHQLSQDLHPFFSKNDVEKATKYYIQTKGQNISTGEVAEPIEQAQFFTAKEELIPKYIQIFKSNKTNHRFHLILGDAGMGKTTFMINLYLKYNSILNFGKKYKIKLFSFNQENIDTTIKKLIDAGEDKDTILLLDAFDEDSNATNNYQNRLDEIIKLVKNFREVLITSRTHFFPSEKDEPFELKIRNDVGYHIFKKTYISPFDDNDIKTYLNKKFWLLPSNKKKRANQIISKSPNLMIRPMLLNYIDDLVKENEPYQYSFQVYHVMIDKWLEREANRKTSDQRTNFKENLYKFSELLALELSNSYRNSSFQIKKDEIFPIAQKYNINLEEFEITSRSLLTRNAAGDWKFAHKSILEYFLAKDLFEKQNVEEICDFGFLGLDQCQTFYREMCLAKYSIDFIKQADNTVLYSLSNNLMESSIRYLQYLKNLRKSFDNLNNPQNKYQHIKEIFDTAEPTNAYYKILQPSLKTYADLITYQNQKSIEFSTPFIKRITSFQDISNLITNLDNTIMSFFQEMQLTGETFKTYHESAERLTMDVEKTHQEKYKQLQLITEDETEKLRNIAETKQQSAFEENLATSREYLNKQFEEYKQSQDDQLSKVTTLTEQIEHYAQNMENKLTIVMQDIEMLLVILISKLTISLNSIRIQLSKIPAITCIFFADPNFKLSIEYANNLIGFPNLRYILLSSSLSISDEKMLQYLQSFNIEVIVLD